jgi:hypothetical protein
MHQRLESGTMLLIEKGVTISNEAGADRYVPLDAAMR